MPGERAGDGSAGDTVNVAVDERKESAESRVRHRRGHERERYTNYVTCSCGWSKAADEDPRGAWAIASWLEHTVIAMQEGA